MRIDTPEFKTWLRAKPHPSKVRVLCEDGKARTVKVNKRTGVRYWKEVLDAIAAFNVLSVELLNEDGDIIRVMQVEAVEETDELGQTAAAATAAVDAHAAPGYGRDSRLVEFARLLLQAYTTGASMQAKSSEVAFNKLAQITETAFKRLDIVEKSLNRQLSRRANAPAGDEDKDDFGAMFEAFMAQAMAKMGGPQAVAAMMNGAAPDGEGGAEGGSDA